MSQAIISPPHTTADECCCFLQATEDDEELLVQVDGASFWIPRSLWLLESLLEVGSIFALSSLISSLCACIHEMLILSCVCSAFSSQMSETKSHSTICFSLQTLWDMQEPFFAKKQPTLGIGPLSSRQVVHQNKVVNGIKKEQVYHIKRCLFQAHLGQIEMSPTAVVWILRAIYRLNFWPLGQRQVAPWSYSCFEGALSGILFSFCFLSFTLTS